MMRPWKSEKPNHMAFLAMFLLGMSTFSCLFATRRKLIGMYGPSTDFLVEVEILGNGRYIPDDICSGCRMSTRDVASETTCWNRMHALITPGNMTVAKAGELVAANHPEQCSRCNPSVCRHIEKRYWHIDRVAPKIQHAASLYLRSIPQHWRLPQEAYDNWTGYFRDANNSRPNREYFMEYNPSIIQLPKAQRVTRDAVYLVCLRVSSYYIHIFHEDRISDMIGSMKNADIHMEYYGFATLRADLTIVDETTVLLHPALTLPKGRTQDMRLVVIEGQMYVKVDHRVLPLWIVPPSRPIDVPIVTMEPVNGSTTHSSLKIMVGTKGPCTENRRGKNLNYFSDEEGRTVMEVYPMIDRRYINFTSYRCRHFRHFTQELPIIDDSRKVPAASFATSDEIKFADFQMPFLPYTFQRGSACCTEITDPRTGRKLLLGVSHAKTEKYFWGYSISGAPTNEVTYNEDTLRRVIQQPCEAAKAFNQGFLMEVLNVNRVTYLSSFYAFEANPPYRTVARSGHFCFGLPSTTELEHAGHPFQHPNTPPTKMLTLAHFTYNCPQIQFITGMVDKVGDPSRVVISYGINDGMSRIVEVDKADIATMLITPENM